MLYTSKCDGKGGQNRIYRPGATIKQIEEEMDIIFTELGYEEGEYPFEKSWRRDGITPKMVLRYAERKAIKCYVHHKGGKIEAHVPSSGLPGPTINFSVFGNHAYWWSRKIDGLGSDRRPNASNAASQSSIASSQPHSFDCFSDKEINKVFATQQGAAYTEFGCMTEMVRNLINNQDAYRAPSGTKRVAEFNKKKRYFCNTPHEADRYTPFKECLKLLMAAMKTMQGSHGSTDPLPTLPWAQWSK